ncbi:MAG TPA: RRXRR domain-containing protein [Nostocaceae cyanobacterium]|nr:RRXRR domain-containing protein [Nostocaceae cyanobacterium]
MSKVLLLDADQQPLSPLRISHARMLLSQGKAVVFRRYPFTIILKESFSQANLEQFGLKVYPDERCLQAVVNKSRQLDFELNKSFKSRRLTLVK